MQPAENIIHDGLGKADLGIAAPPAGLEARVSKLLAEKFERNPVLQRDGDRQGKAVHEPGNRGAFLGHGDEQFPRSPIRIKSDGDVTLMTGNLKLVRNRSPLLRQLVPHRSRRPIKIFFLHMWSGHCCPRIFLTRSRRLSSRR